MKIREFVCICPIDYYDKVLLIEKKRPKWQEGKLNLVGGKIERGETPIDAAIREFDEETNCTIDDPVLAGKIIGPDFIVNVITGFTLGRLIGQPTDEWVDWYKWPFQLEHNINRLIPNLFVVIPMCLSRQIGWNIIHDHHKSPNDHEITIRVA